MRKGVITLSLSFLVAIGCVTEGTAPVRDEDNGRFENSKNPDPLEAGDNRIRSIIEELPSLRGQKLLHALEFLVSQKQLAVEPVLAALPDANSRTRANLLYVLSWSRTKEARAALVEHLNHPDTMVRYESAAGLLQQGEMSAAPVMLELLDSKDRQTRFKAIESLRNATGRDFGYQFSADDESRSAAVARWQNWWREEQGRLMVRRPIDGDGATAGERVTNSR